MTHQPNCFINFAFDKKQSFDVINRYCFGTAYYHQVSLSANKIAQSSNRLKANRFNIQLWRKTFYISNTVTTKNQTILNDNMYLPINCTQSRNLTATTYGTTTAKLKEGSKALRWLAVCSTTLQHTLRHDSHTPRTRPSGDHSTPARSSVSVSKCCECTTSNVTLALAL